MDISALKRDSVAISEGQWVSDIPGMGEVRMRVRGFSSTAAVELRARKERAIPKDQRNRDGSLKPDVASALFSDVLADAILLDVEGLTAGGKALDVDAVRGLLRDPDYAPLADAVAWAASAVDKGMADAAEDLGKN